MNAKDFATFKAYSAVYDSSNACLGDLLVSGRVEHTVPLKRVQFETFPDLVDRLEFVCAALGISKREFLERAVADSLEVTWSTFQQTYQQLTGEPYPESVASDPETFTLELDNLDQEEPTSSKPTSSKPTKKDTK